MVDAIALDLDRLDLLPGRIGDEAQRARVRPHLDVCARERRLDAADLGVALRVNPAGEGIARAAQDAAAGLAGSNQPQRQVGGMEALTLQPVDDRPPFRRRAESAGTERVHAPVRSDRRWPARARDRAARRARSKARACRSRWARRETRRPCARSTESPRAATGRARCPRTSYCRRRRSGCRAGTPRPARRASARSRGSGGASTPPPDSSCPALAAPARRARRRGPAHGPADSARAIVPPPAPLPMMMTS